MRKMKWRHRKKKRICITNIKLTSGASIRFFSSTGPIKWILKCTQLRIEYDISNTLANLFDVIVCICDVLVVIAQSCKWYRLCIQQHCILFKCSQLHRLYSILYIEINKSFAEDEIHLVGILLLSCAQIISLLFVGSLFVL